MGLHRLTVLGAAVGMVLAVAGCSAAVVDSTTNAAAGDKSSAASGNYPAVDGNWTYAAHAFAGTGSQGDSGDNGPASNALLWQPSAVVQTPDGSTTFVTDTFNNVIRQVNSEGTISTIAGDGAPCEGVVPIQPCGDGGPALRAQLNRPSGLALSPDGTQLYIADTGANRIRSLALTAGTITTVAGTGQIGYGGDGASAVQARLAQPADVAVDAGGNLFIADTDNNRVRKVDASGVITTVVGSGAACNPSGDDCGVGGPATSGQLSEPSGVTVSTAGSTSGLLLIADTNTHTIRSVDQAGTFGNVMGSAGQAGTGTDGSSVAAAQLNLPRRVSVAGNGTMIVSDTGNQRLLAVSPILDRVWQANSSGISMVAPWSAFATSTGIVYADQGGNQVVSLTSPQGPNLSWTQCGPDAYTHGGPTGRMTDTVFLLPGTTSVDTQAWGAAGGAAPSGGQVTWEALGAGGPGGYAQTEAPVPAASTMLAVVVGCAGQTSQSASSLTPFGGSGSGGGSTVLAEMTSYLNGVATGATFVVAGGGGGGSGPVCVVGPFQSPASEFDNPACGQGAPSIRSQQGNAGANGAGSPGAGVRPGNGQGQGGIAVDWVLYGSAGGANGLGGPGGANMTPDLVGPSVSPGGWGPQWCPTTCSSLPGAGGSGANVMVVYDEAGNGQLTTADYYQGGGGGGGAGGGAGGASAGSQTGADAGGDGGGSWAMCADPTTTNQPSQGNGQLSVQPGSRQLGKCTPLPVNLSAAAKSKSK